MAILKIESAADAQQNRLVYKAATRRLVYWMLCTEVAQTYEPMASRPNDAEPLTRENAKACSHELKIIARCLRALNTALPPEVIASLEVAIKRRQAQARWYTSDPDSDSASNASHQRFIETLIELFETLTGKKWMERLSFPRPSNASKTRHSSHTNKSNYVQAEGDTDTQNYKNRFIALATVDVVTVEAGWSCFYPLNDARQELMDSLALDMTEDRTVDEVVICLNEGVRNLHELGSRLHSAYSKVSDVEDVTVLEKLEGFMGVEPEDEQDTAPSPSSRSRRMESLMLDELRAYVLNLRLPAFRTSEQLREFLNLDAFYKAAVAAVQSHRVPSSFIWMWEPYFTMRNLLAQPNSPFLIARSAHISDVESSLRTNNDHSIAQEHAAIRGAIVTARQLSLNLGILGASAYKYPISTCLQSLAVMLYQHRAGLIGCSARGDVGLLSHIYVNSVVFDLFPEDPDEDESHINQWNDMETAFEAHGESFDALQNFPKLLAEANFSTREEHEAAELESEIECRARAERLFLERFPVHAGKATSHVDQGKYPLESRSHLEDWLREGNDLSASNIQVVFARTAARFDSASFSKDFSKLYDDTCLDYISFANFCSDFLDLLSQRSESHPSHRDIVAQVLGDTAAHERLHPLALLQINSKLTRMAGLLRREKDKDGDCMLVNAVVWKQQMLFWKFIDI